MIDMRRSRQRPVGFTVLTFSVSGTLAHPPPRSSSSPSPLLTPLPAPGRSGVPRAQTAYEEKKDKRASMNWNNLGRSGGGGGKRGKTGRRGAGAATPHGAVVEEAAGMDAAWKETMLPKEGDELRCKHFKACAGCEFDRRFDETPIMVDSRCGDVCKKGLAFVTHVRTRPDCEVEGCATRFSDLDLMLADNGLTRLGQA